MVPRAGAPAGSAQPGGHWKGKGFWGSQRGLGGDLLMDESLQICLEG